MSPNEQEFVDALIACRIAEQAESRARQRTYGLEKVTFNKQQALNAARVKLIGHDRMLNTDEERKKLFDLIQVADQRMKP